MRFVTLMNTWSGRAARVVAGLGLIALGFVIGGGVGIALSILGAVPVLTGALNICLLGPLFGGRLQGTRCSTS